MICNIVFLSDCNKTNVSCISKTLRERKREREREREKREINGIKAH